MAPRPVLRDTGYLGGRRYVLAVGVYALGVRLAGPGSSFIADRAYVAHQPVRTPDEAADVIAVSRALAP